MTEPQNTIHNPEFRIPIGDLHNVQAVLCENKYKFRHLIFISFAVYCARAAF